MFRPTAGRLLNRHGMKAPKKSPDESWSRNFCDVLEEEFRVVGNDFGGPPAKGARPGNIAEQIARAHRKQLVGLALSGGGIRSATFSLGVLQALARMKLLSEFDYLSTVSGGGYIGCWLMAWIKRRGLADVESALNPEWVKQPGRSEPDEIRFLRRFSNYLTPKLGWLGADTWTVIATYLRNLFLNLMVLISAMTLLLLLPRLVVLLEESVWPAVGVGWCAAVAILAMIFAMAVITRSLFFFRRGGIDDREPTMTAEDYEKVDMIPLLAGDQLSRWRDDEGQPLSDPVADAVLKSNVWFDQPFDDFVLTAKFSLASTAESGILVWQNSGPATGGGETAVGGHLIYLGQSQFHLEAEGGTFQAQRAGAIDDNEPSRSVQLNLENNSLEIMCVKDVITVTLNGLTINRQRVTGSAAAKNSANPGLIGLRKADGVTFKEVYVRPLPSTLDRGGTQGQIQRWIVGPLFLAAFLATFVLYFGDVPKEGIRNVVPMRFDVMRSLRGVDPWSWTYCAALTGSVVGGAVLLVRLALVGWERIRAWTKGQKARRRFSWRAFGKIVREALCLGAASYLGGYAARELYEIFRSKTIWEVTTFGTPAVILVSMLVITLHLGFMGRALPDQVREWWSRLGAWLLIYSLLWLALFGTAFYAPPFFDYVNSWLASAGWVAVSGWLGSTIWGVFAARGEATGRKNSGGKVRELVAQIAPYIFIVGLFLLLAWAIDLLVPAVAGTMREHADAKDTFSNFLTYEWLIMENSSGWYAVGLIAAAAAAVAAVLSWRLDINQFSMHLLYRNRLGRCYLGASNRFRRAQPFTGFATADDFDLWELEDLIKETPDATGAAKKRMTGPYLIVNSALNLVGGKELAWQERKAASFVFTQRFCGYEFPELPPGYTPTLDYAASSSRVSLATAMAISGAAASPNMGYHTSPASAFLMTVFNVRLGWWLGNPRRENTWTKSSPGNVLLSLMSELFGLTSEKGRFVYLSDGGHFENLGLYELVRRRCRFIVACDAEEDHDFSFDGLGNAIEKCRSDLGVDLEIDVEPIRQRSEKGYSAWHCAIGHIRYSRVDPDGRDGILVYLKSSLTGDEPTDVLRYKAENPEFPHQSTADQWFNESQFESYRALGFHATEEVFSVVDALDQLSQRTTEELFVDLAQHWYPPSAAARESFSKHTQSLVAIYHELRTNADLAFLSEQIYPEWRVFFADTKTYQPNEKSPRSLRSRLPKEAGPLRAGFYLCNSVILLMESVYLDLKLEEEYDHPDNRGWMNFFKHWSWAPIFRVAYTISASNYGARFQSFCERQLDLKIGGTDCAEITLHVDPLGKERPGRTDDLSKALANALRRWLIGRLPLDAQMRTRATATAAAEVPKEPKISEPEALKIAGQKISEAVIRRLEQPGLPDPPVNEDDEWMAAAILVELVRREAPDVRLDYYANKVADSVLFHGACIAHRFSTAGMEDHLNVAERELIELFFLYNPKLILSSQIVYFYLVPDSSAANSRFEEKNASDTFRFPFGFAILARTGDRRKLVYFRVQDHLRSMGLASQALEKLITNKKIAGPDLTLQQCDMHPDAHESPTPEERRRFMRLFDSAKTAVCQKSIRETQAEFDVKSG